MPKKRIYTEKIINAFLMYSTPSEIMKECNLTYDRYKGYRRDEDFQRILQQRRDEIIKESTHKLQRMYDDCINVVHGIAMNPETKEQIKINACQLLMGQCKAWTDTKEIIERLEKLENAQNDTFNGVHVC